MGRLAGGRGPGDLDLHVQEAQLVGYVRDEQLAHHADAADTERWCGVHDEHDPAAGRESIHRRGRHEHPVLLPGDHRQRCRVGHDPELGVDPHRRDLLDRPGRGPPGRGHVLLAHLRLGLQRPRGGDRPELGAVLHHRPAPRRRRRVCHRAVRTGDRQPRERQRLGGYEHAQRHDTRRCDRSRSDLQLARLGPGPGCIVFRRRR